MSDQWPLVPRPRFTSAAQNMVQVGTSMFVPWNKDQDQVLDVGAYAGQLWRDWQTRDRAAGGSGEPDAFVPPPPIPLPFGEEIDRCTAALHAIAFFRKVSPTDQSRVEDVLKALEHDQLPESLCVLVARATRTRLAKYGN